MAAAQGFENNPWAWRPTAERASQSHISFLWSWTAQDGTRMCVFEHALLSNLGNVLVERADGDVIQLSVMDPSKGIKVSLTKRHAPLRKQGVAILGTTEGGMATPASWRRTKARGPTLR